jgi:NOL1/NOP2/sun family putative RNA methylase
MRHEPKTDFKERISRLMKNPEDEERFWKIIHTQTPDSIRCNTLKISPDELRMRLEKKGWRIEQPFSENKEIMIVSGFEMGGLGKSKEHLLGYYYVQEISSMLAVLALSPKEGEIILDLCSSPGSKTTQAAAMMNNSGTIIANDNNIGRVRILASNLERCGVMNSILTRMDGAFFCQKLRKARMRFDKILVDAPCSGEGTLRKSPKTLMMWNQRVIENLSGVQKKLAAEAFKILRTGGEMVYSTCTLAPEENEEVLNTLAKQFDFEFEKISLPLKCRNGIKEWDGKSYNPELEKACRIYPQDNDTDGFFLCKIRKLSEKNCSSIIDEPRIKKSNFFERNCDE